MIKVLGNRVLLQPLAKKEVSDGGILFPQQYQDDRMQWIVRQRGTGATLHPEVQVGDCVLTPLYFDHYTFEDQSGWKIVGLDQLIAVWREEETANQKETPS